MRSLKKRKQKRPPKGKQPSIDRRLLRIVHDEAAIEKSRTKPLDAMFAQIDKIKTADDVKHEIAELHQSGVPVLFRLAEAPTRRTATWS